MSQTNLIDLKNLNLEDLTALLCGLGKEKFRARQIMRWIYTRGVTSFAEMTDLSKALREDLSQRAFISNWQPEVTEQSVDGTKKYLFPSNRPKSSIRCAPRPKTGR